MVLTEERKERFKRLPEKRVNKVKKEIRLIGNLSRNSAYKYTIEDIEKMKKSLTRSSKKRGLDSTQGRAAAIKTTLSSEVTKCSLNHYV